GVSAATWRGNTTKVHQATFKAPLCARYVAVAVRGISNPPTVGRASLLIVCLISTFCARRDSTSANAQKIIGRTTYGPLTRATSPALNPDANDNATGRDEPRRTAAAAKTSDESNGRPTSPSVWVRWTSVATA